MLEELRFSNFKSWGGSTRLQLGRITGLFGPNSSGKSAALQVLLLLKQTSEQFDRDLVLDFGGSESDYADFGSFADIVHDHDLSRVVEIGFTWLPHASPPSRSRYPPIRQRIRRAGIDVALSTIGSTPIETVVVENLKYRMEGLRLRSAGLPIPSQEGSVLRRISLEFDRAEEGYYKVSLQPDAIAALRSEVGVAPQGLYGYPREAFHDILGGEFRSIEGELERSFSQIPFLADSFLRSITYVGPLRAHPRRYYQWSGASTATIGHAGEDAIPLLVAELTRRPAPLSPFSHQLPLFDLDEPPSRPTVDAIRTWLQRLGIAHEVQLEPLAPGSRIWQFLVRTAPGGPAVNIADGGFGVSQILPVVVALLAAKRGSLVILDHPELHLHPRVQMDLADLLIYITEASDIQVLLESHSEHLLARLQRRIAERGTGTSGLSSSDLRLYFCRLSEGASVLEQLDVDESGTISNWPTDFFGDTFSERGVGEGQVSRSGGVTSTIVSIHCRYECMGRRGGAFVAVTDVRDRGSRVCSVTGWFHSAHRGGCAV